ncbi:MAG: ParM/StbA family protein [Acidiferrobacteraceae bacterium]
MDPFIVGLDVGYSNLKVAWGTAHAKPYTHIAPAAGGPAEQLSERLGSDGVGGGARVWMGDTPWVVGVEPRRIEGFVRTMPADYPQTAIYRALCFAALQGAGRDRVDVRVTGLPVTEYPMQRAVCDDC